MYSSALTMCRCKHKSLVAFNGWRQVGLKDCKATVKLEVYWETCDQEKITWQESEQTYSQDLEGAVVWATSCESHLDNMLVLSVHHVHILFQYVGVAN